jgi:hypothetical protein
MKFSIWDFLALFTLGALILIGVLFLQIFMNPYTAFNPFPPPTLPPHITIPSATSTPRSLPPTWTPEAPSGATRVEATVRVLPSATPQFTPTGFVLPSFTPTQTFTITPTLTPTRTVDQGQWLRNIPADGTVLRPGQDFDVVWVVKNIGTNEWSKRYYFSYVRGTKIHEDDSYNLREEVVVDDTTELIIDAVAPTETGNYSTVWQLFNDAGKPMLTLTFSFTVR